MPLVVMKFGGTSVADSARIMRAAARIARARRNGNNVVVTVSAQGNTTDDLVALAREVSPSPPPREMDQLLSTGEQVSAALMAMALAAMETPAVSLTAAQAGIITDNQYTRSRIRKICTERLARTIEAGQVAVVTGFQGVDDAMNVTTMGRGNSDTTALALASVLGADVCEIYTDVDGVYTADPRIVPDARKIPRITYDEMLELASLGAGVLHGRSVEFAKKHGVVIHVRSSFDESEGTLVTKETEAVEGIAVAGAALDKDEAKITVKNVPDRPGIAATLFGRIASGGISVDVIVQNISEKGATDVSFTVASRDLAEALRLTREVAEEIEASDVASTEHIAKVSIVGVGMRSQPGVAARLFGALAEAGINIEMITTSEIKVSCVIDASQAEEALRVVHKAFGLEKSPQ